MERVSYDVDGPPRAALRASLACPKCGKRWYGAIPRAGDLWLTCERKSCGAEVWAIVLPPDARGFYLASLFSPRVAASLIRSVLPAVGDPAIPDEVLWQQPLAGHDARAYLVIEVRSHQRHRLMFSPPDQIASDLALARR